MKKRKKQLSWLSIVLMIGILISMSGVLPVTGYAADDQVFFENFETYAENAYPASFALQYNGTGTPNQKVITTVGYNGSNSKVFQLAGAPSWASEQYVSLQGALPANIVIDAYIKPVTSSRNAELALRNLSIGTWGTRISSVIFEGNGTILAVGNGNDFSRVIGSYTVGNWYRVTLDNDLTAKTYDIYLDGVLAASDVPMHPTVSPKEMSLIAHNIGTSMAYFDEVGIYTELPDFAIELPSASNVAITGSVKVGESLRGQYEFSGTSESGTTYRWLADSGSESDVFNTQNIAGVNNGPPPEPAVFVLSETTLISRIENYHYNNGNGAVPGTISLQAADGRLYGPWDAVGLHGNKYWEVMPYVELPAGTYTVIDSSNETWANNYESGYRGMMIVSKKIYSNNFSPISGAADQDYLLTANDFGKMIMFEVIVRESSGLTGTPATSSAVGPVTVSGPPVLAPPPVPSGLTATAGNGEVTLEWNEVNSAYYKLYYSTTPDDFSQENSLEVYDATTHTMTGLTNGTTYYFAVKAAHDLSFSALSGIVSATPQDTNISKNYIVMFNTQGGSTISPIIVNEGSLITEPVLEPMKSTFTFNGWYKEEACVNAWDFASDVVTENKILFAKWLPVQIANIAAMYTMSIGNKLTLDPQPSGGTWEWDEEFFAVTFNSPATFTALKTGISTILYTVHDVTREIVVTVQEDAFSDEPEPREDSPADPNEGDSQEDGVLPQTGGNPFVPFVGLLISTLGLLLRKRQAMQ